jgi:hypothetical protein
VAIDLALAAITTLATLGSAVATMVASFKLKEVGNSLLWIWQRKRLTIRSIGALLGVGVAIYLALSNLLIAGIVLTSTEIVRLLNPRGSGQAWKLKDLNLHIASEVFFHCLAFVGVAVGLTCVALGVFTDLELGPQVTISLTLGITALVAVNKSTARTRKLCSEISKRTLAVVRSFAELHEVYDQAARRPARHRHPASLLHRHRRRTGADRRLADLRRKCLDEVDGLTLALATRINTGYRIFGTPILPSSDFRRLIAELRVAARLGDQKAGPWRAAAPKLQQIRRACGRWTDEMA